MMHVKLDNLSFIVLSYGCGVLLLEIERAIISVHVLWFVRPYSVCATEICSFYFWLSWCCL